MTEYTFGDTDLARERLGLVADTFAPPTRALLRSIPWGTRRYILDLGCGPGYTSGLLLDAFPDSFVTGFDASPAMVDEARERVPEARFVVADITTRLRLPAHLVYARLLLGHLPDPKRALEHWAAALLPAGVLVCEEPVRYRSDDALFARYEDAVTNVVAAGGGGTLWAGPALDTDPPDCDRGLDRVVEHPVPASRAAAMFWRNAVTWGGAPDMIDALQAVERDGGPDVMWEIRQTVWVKR